MKHLSIFLSMILAFAFGAFAQTGVEQGKYFTLTKQSGADVTYYLTSNSSAPVVRTGELANSFFWTTESATQGASDNYYLRLGSYYLSVKAERPDNTSKYTYKAILTSSKSNAATWIVDVQQGDQNITLYNKDFGQANIAEENKAQNICLGMVSGTVQMTDESQNWKLTIDRAYYDKAYQKAVEKVGTLTDVEALWDNAAIIAEFDKQQTEYQHKYSLMANGNIIQAISSMTAVFDGIYDRLYASIPTKVINLGDLEYNEGELKSGSDLLERCWTIARSGSGYTFQNSFSGLYIRFFPAKDPVYNQGILISPATEAYFGMSSSATVFDLEPSGADKVVLSYQDQTFTLDKPASATSEEMPLEVKTVEADGLFAAASGYFVDAKTSAAGFLDDVKGLTADTDESLSLKAEFDEAKTGVEAFEPKAPAATASAVEVISSIRKQLADINTLVNKAAVPMLLVGEKDNVKYYITAATVPMTNSAVVGSNTYSVPAVSASALGSTVMSQRLANALWTFDYVGDGRARFINAEGLYLSEPYTDPVSHLEGIIATDYESQAAALAVNGSNLTFGKGDRLEIDDITSFQVESASVMPKSSLVDTEGNPAEQNSYYYIASIGAGGVLGAATPTDAVTHNATNLGSYWWLEEATTDRNENAYFIHSIYPGYYLGRDLKLVKAEINSDRSDLVWYVDENGIAPAPGKFNGYNSGLVISNNSSVNSGRVITANAFASNGTINPGLNLSSFSANNWRNNGWMFVKAGDVEDIINEYIEKDIAWQVEALTVALDNIKVPFSTNALSAGIADIEDYYSEISDGELTAPEKLAKAAELSVIMTGIQTKFNEEVFNNALNRNYHIVNQGIASSNAYLAGSSSSLRLVNFVDANYKNPDTEWHFVNAGNNASSGFSLLNSNNSALGSVTNSGNVGSSRGYYHLSLDVMWITRDANYNITAVSPWYNVPAELKTLSAPGSVESQAAFDDAILFGLGLEGVNTPGRGLAGTENASVVSAEIYSPMAQWELIHYNPSITGIDGVDADATTAEEIMLYNLQGIRVDRATAAPGIYISVRSDGSVVKVVIN